MDPVCRYSGEDGKSLLMWCPGCEGRHMISLSPDGWTFDGDLERPTITPSILVRSHGYPHGVDPAPGEVQQPGPQVCHSFVREGRWEFLGDSTHALAGQTVDMVPLPSGSSR